MRRLRTKTPSRKRRLAVWVRAAAAWHSWQGATIARIGDNMRQVAVTEGEDGMSLTGTTEIDSCVNVDKLEPRR